jgi:hypothetical protein
MRKPSIIGVCILCSFLLSACSPRDFLTRRLAGDLIATSNNFRSPQSLQLQTGVVSNKDYSSPEYLVLQHRGWISATHVPCPLDIESPPCWDVTLTPSGVDTFRGLIAPAETGNQSFRIAVARRELVAIAGISKLGRVADVEFTWRWIPLNEVGAALYSSDLNYRSTATFRDYDDGWRISQAAPRSGQSLDEALKNAEPAQ